MAGIKVEIFYAIVTNYLVASATGFLLNPISIPLSSLPQQSWFYSTLALGVLFIVIFNVMAKSSQTNGVAVTSVATKMSLIIPVLFGVIYYKEQLSTWQVFGIGLALIAVYLASVKSNTTNTKLSYLLLPFIVFVGSGVIDTGINFIKDTHLTEQTYSVFSSTVFGFPGVIGCLVIAYRALTKSFSFTFKNIIGGICLGIPNYFSIFFLLRALNNPNFNSATVFTINNVAIVLFSTFLGIVLFKEKLDLKNWIGVALASLSIILVALF